jgi:hypothetical protein
MLKNISTGEGLYLFLKEQVFADNLGIFRQPGKYFTIYDFLVCFSSLPLKTSLQNCAKPIS